MSRFFRMLPLLFIAGFAEGHDLWLEPRAFQVPAGSRLALSVMLGEALRVEERRPLTLDPVVRFTRFGPGSDGDDLMRDPAPNLSDPGTHLIVMERVTATAALDGPKFQTYLEEEGHLDQALDRIRAGEQLHAVRERFSRHLKTWVRVGEGPARAEGPVGMRLEIVPEKDPTRLAAGEELAVRLLFEGEPLPGTRVVLASRGSNPSERPSMGRTDAQGRVVLRVPSKGVQMIRATHLRRCTGCAAHEWESFWAAGTFEIE